MDLNQLQALVAQGESGSLEFKKSTGLLKPAFETVCAFLNTKGGHVLIGVSDNGSLIGQEITDKTRQEIANEIAKIEPPSQISIKYYPLEAKKSIIVITVEEGKYPPYIYEGRSFQRNESTTIRMPQHYYEQLLIKRGHLNYSWDESIASGYSIDDLDHEEIRRTIRLGIQENRIPEVALTEEIPDLLRRLKLVVDGKLTNAAVLLFAKDVLPNYPQFHIKLARFKGLDRLGEFIDNQSFYGNAFTVLSQASNFITKHLPVASHYKETSLERVNVPALPPLAIREAIINAICHKDYSNRGTSISLAIYDDRLEVWNYGELPRELSIESLKQKHESYPRNKLVAIEFYNRGLIEKWGTGTLKMYKLCETQGLPVPEFEEYSGGLGVTFRFQRSTDTSSQIEGSERVLTPRQQHIIDILGGEGSLTTKNLIEKLQHTTPERSLRRELVYLEKIGLLDVKGHTSSRVWSIKKG